MDHTNNIININNKADHRMVEADGADMVVVEVTAVLLRLLGIKVHILMDQLVMVPGHHNIHLPCKEDHRRTCIIIKERGLEDLVMVVVV